MFLGFSRQRGVCLSISWFFLNFSHLENRYLLLRIPVCDYVEIVRVGFAAESNKMKLKNFWTFVGKFVLYSIFITEVIGRQQISDDSSEHASARRVENNALKEYFESILDLRKQTSGNDGRSPTRDKDRGHVPLYVQNLYDLMALDTENGNRPDQRSTFRRRRSLSEYNFGTGENAVNAIGEPVTIQAIEREHTLDGGNPGEGYVMQFDLEQLWISKNQLQLAELVLAVDYSLLTAPPGFYSVYAYVVEGDGLVPASRTRLLVSAGSLGVLDTFRNNFVKLRVTDSVVQKVLADGPRSITFEIVVAQNGTLSRRDLPRHHVEQLFHLASRGVHQPLLVLYSSTAASKIEQDGDYDPQPRRRRSARAASLRRCAHNDECCLHEWWIDLVELFRDTWPILMPEGFYANYCAGKCPYPMYDGRLNATGNAHVRAAYNSHWRHQTGRNIANKSTNVVPEATCVAQDPSSITIVYRVGERFIIRQIEGMAAHSCMCA